MQSSSGSSAIFTSSDAQSEAAPSFVDELEAALHDDQDEDEDEDDADQTLLDPPKAHKPRRKGIMSDRDRLEFLRFLKSRNLSIGSLLRSLFPADLSKYRSDHFNPAPDAPSSSPSAYSSTDDYMHIRIAQWLSGTEPNNFAKRWKGMDAFAVELVAKIIDNEARKAISSKYIAGPASGKMTTKILAAYDPTTSAQLAASLCPVSQRMLDAITGATGEDEEDAEQISEEDIDGSSESDSDKDRSAGQILVRKTWSDRGLRSKQGVASTSLHSLLFARSRECSMFAQTMSLLQFASRTSKRSIELLSRVGICVSPQTITRMTDALAKDIMSESRKILQQKETVVTLSIDNLNWKSDARDKTALRGSSMMAAVAGNIFVINAQYKYEPGRPICKPELIHHLFGNDIRLPTTNEQPLNPLDASGRPIAMDRKARDDRRAQCFQNPPTPYDFVPGALEQDHLIQCTVAHALRLWLELHSECSFDDKAPPPPQIFPFVPHKSLVIPLPIYNHDEGSIQGNIEVIESVCKDFGLDEEWLMNHVVVAIGDAFTATLQRKAVKSRKSDLSRTPERDRLQFLEPLAAFFHFQFAYQRFMIDTHSGTAMLQDLISLRRISSRAGYKNLTTGTLDYHDNDAFLRTYFGAMVDVVISGALRQGGHGDQVGDETLVGNSSSSRPQTEDVQPGDGQPGDEDEQAANDQAEDEDEQVPAEDDVNDDAEEGSPDEDPDDPTARAPVREQTAAMPEGGLRQSRHSENEFENLEWNDLLRIATEAITRLMRGNVAAQAGANESKGNTDQLYGHAIALFRDLAVYTELRHATKHGDPGRIMAMVRQCLPRFQYAGHHRYVSECLEMMFLLKHELPHALRTVMMGGTLVNHAGRPDTFIPADLDIEHIVNDCKNTFPVQAKAGGSTRQRKIGILLPTLRASRKRYDRAFRIASIDATHHTASNVLTSRLLSAEMEEYAVFERQTSGRASPVFEARRLARRNKNIATDAFISGVEGLLGTSNKLGSIPQFIARRASGLEEEEEGTGTTSTDVAGVIRDIIDAAI
ncbi:hypothetical protein CF319_g1472 [Tilletia indica]|nr:hypothetical protein CF319_g1472 [Tilletia indica]